MTSHQTESLPLEEQDDADTNVSATSEPPSATTEAAGNLDDSVVEELTRRLPTAELIKIIKGALECGKRNMPFTESELLRAMTFGVTGTRKSGPTVKRRV
jgi:hypothetical protein